MSSHFSADLNHIQSSGSDASREGKHANSPEEVAEYQKLMKDRKADLESTTALDYAAGSEDYRQLNNIINDIFSSISGDQGANTGPKTEPEYRNIRNDLLQRARKLQNTQQTKTGNAAVDSRRDAAKGPQ